MNESVVVGDEETALLASWGAHVRQWRLITGVSAQLLADRAHISLPTLRRIESGEGTVRLHSFVAVLVALQLDERLKIATDPLDTDIGRARAHLLGRARAPRPR